jgi:hypothetical protein
MLYSRKTPGWGFLLHSVYHLSFDAITATVNNLLIESKPKDLTATLPWLASQLGYDPGPFHLWQTK